MVALGEAAARVREQVNEHIAGNEEVQTVVHALERQYDTFVAAQEQQSSLLAGEADLPSGDEIGAEFEKFLAEQAGNDDFGSAGDSIEATTDENVTGGAHNSTLCAFRNPSVTWLLFRTHPSDSLKLCVIFVDGSTTGADSQRGHTPSQEAT